MTQNFKAVVIDNQNEKFIRAIKELKTSDLVNKNEKHFLEYWKKIKIIRIPKI